MILSERSGWIRTRELEEEALRNDLMVEANRGEQFPGWIILRVQRKFENERYEVNGA